jgi:LysR family transcriptional regulator, glycine cleavage system transcriptional activator
MNLLHLSAGRVSLNVGAEVLKDVSLSTVKAFDSAARHGSFRAAASELNLSPSAISHAILKLEQTLGTSLFEREGRLVRLSPDGETLMRHVGLAFDELRRGMELVSNRGPQLLRLHSAPSFAAQWLTPRLSGFFASHPGIEVRLAASTDYARFVNDEFDADIVYGPSRVEGVVSIPLGPETVTPLCSPELAERIKEIVDLTSEVLIQSDLKRVRWSDWFKANDKESPVPHGARFDRSFLAIAAACDGLGVALESTRLAEREIKSGRLVAPLAGRAKDVDYVGHYLVFPRAGRQRRAVRVFADWLLDALGLPRQA